MAFEIRILGPHYIQIALGLYVSQFYGTICVLLRFFKNFPELSEQIHITAWHKAHRSRYCSVVRLARAVLYNCNTRVACLWEWRQSGLLSAVGVRRDTVVCGNVAAPLCRSAHIVCHSVTGHNATLKQQQASNPGPVKRSNAQFHS